MRYQTELHWERISYLLVANCILLLALSQFHSDVLLRSLTSLVGLATSGGWYLVVHRSSQYFDYWKKEIRRLEVELGRTSIYPRALGGMKLRNIAHIFPISFSLLWLLVLISFLSGVLLGGYSI
jgi:hypothetical protein